MLQAMKDHKIRLVIFILICAVALGTGVGLFVLFREQPHKSRYDLSDERMFRITNLDQVVDSLRESLKQRSREIGISFSFRGDYIDDISPFVKELMELAQKETGRPDEGDYIRYQLGGYTFSYGHEAAEGGYDYSIIITPSYYSNAEQEKQTEEKVKEITYSLSLPGNAGDYEKVRAVYDYIKKNVTYDIVHKKNQYHTVRSTAYGALVSRSATCQGISVAAYRLLMELGVECRVITGTGSSASGEEYHAWNIVCVDGLYYNMDITWDMTYNGEEFFLKCDENFTGHERDDEFKGPEFYSRYPMAARDCDTGF